MNNYRGDMIESEQELIETMTKLGIAKDKHEEFINVIISHEETVSSFISKYTYLQISQVISGFRQEIDVRELFNPTFDNMQMMQIRAGLKAGVDIKKYAKPEYNWMQMNKLRQMILKGYDFDFMFDPQLDFDQLNQISEGLDKNIEVSLYANNRYTSKEMYCIRRALEDKIVVSEGEELSQEQVMVYCSRYLSELEISKLNQLNSLFIHMKLVDDDSYLDQKHVKRRVEESTDIGVPLFNVPPNMLPGYSLQPFSVSDTNHIPFRMIDNEKATAYFKYFLEEKDQMINYLFEIFSRCGYDKSKLDFKPSSIAVLEEFIIDQIRPISSETKRELLIEGYNEYRKRLNGFGYKDFLVSISDEENEIGLSGCSILYYCGIYFAEVLRINNNLEWQLELENSIFTKSPVLKNNSYSHSVVLIPWALTYAKLILNTNTDYTLTEVYLDLVNMYN